MAKKSVLEPYYGKLNAAETTAGINMAIKNATRLLEDSKLLFVNEKYPSSLALAILAIEESGKISILRSLVLSSDSKEIRDQWKRYRNHKSKNTAWIILDLVYKGARKLEELKECVNEKGEHAELLDGLKQISFYTDCLGDKNWSFPEDVIDKNLTASIIKVAEILCSKKAIEVREIELWIKHMKGNETSKKALSEWHLAMLQEGLTTTSFSDFSDFIELNHNVN